LAEANGRFVSESSAVGSRNQKARFGCEVFFVLATEWRLWR
jgi:hypothetical protein